MNRLMDTVACVVMMSFFTGCSEKQSTLSFSDSDDAPNSKRKSPQTPVTNATRPRTPSTRQPVQRDNSWPRFRGPNGSGVSKAKGLPVQWTETKNVIWRTKLPGPGGSSPITVGDQVFVTCYTGYGLDPKSPGDQKNLRRHVLCVSRSTGKILWDKQFVPVLPESQYDRANGGHHGYSSSTPATDGERLYVFFGKSGMYCLDLKGKEIWHTRVGNELSGYGSANSPLLYKNLVIINASIESRSVVALNKMTGKEVWRAPDVRNAYNSPVLVDAPDGRKELVLNESSKVLALDPESGKELWRVGGFRYYVCPSVVAHNGIVYVLRSHALAIRAGGRGDVTDSHVLWKGRASSNVPSPVYYKGHLYWSQDGHAGCLNATNGELVYVKRFAQECGRIYSSMIVAEGRLYSVSRHDGTFVLSAKPEFEQLAHNVFADDNSRVNASPIAVDGQILLRTDRYLYSISRKAGD